MVYEVAIKKAALSAEEEASLNCFPGKIAGRPDRIQQWLKNQPEWVVLKEVPVRETKQK
jgi:hypothetical protein